MWGKVGIGPWFGVHFFNLPMNKAYIMSSFVDSSWIKKTLCLRYFTEFIWGSFGIVT